tara:strand:+ start:562 stop:1371 length:810 start_codon:yes stop_codon:yes gene_type:complete
MFVHNFDPVLIDLGFLQIRWYSLSYIFGLIVGWFVVLKLIKFTSVNNHNFEQIKKTDFDNSVIYIVLGIILGGRLGYVIFYNFDYYSENFIEIFKLWQGGMSFHGGLIGTVLSIIIFSRIEKVDFFKLSDLVSCVAPIGIFLGRIANFINGELYGKASSLPWSVIFPNAGDEARHPSQIYEGILEGFILFLLINFLALKKQLIFKKGYISGIFLVIYSIFRMFSEIFREPDLHLGYFFNYFSMGTLLSLVTLIFGILIIDYVRKNEQSN